VIEAGQEIRCMLIPMRQGRLLLPSSAVAEVIGYRPPGRVDGGPAWFQGTVNWHQRDVPVIDFEHLIGRTDRRVGIRQRITICYGIGNSLEWPLVGIVAQGIPRLLRVGETSIQIANGGAPGAGAIRMMLSIAGENLLVPDMEYLQGALAA
jgi:chemosensory pili system protein ChpC